MNDIKLKKGFTLIELLVSLVITSVILTSLATLAFAMSSASKTFDDTSMKQSQVRLATLRIKELIKKSNLVCYSGNEDIALWLNDNNNDSRININELVYIEFGANADHLRLCSFSSSDDSPIELSSINSFSSNWFSAICDETECITLLSECSNLKINFDLNPPQSRFINISFEIEENDISRQYQINSTLLGRVDNLIDSTNNIINDDD